MYRRRQPAGPSTRGGVACLSETILLALAGAGRDYGVGEDLDVSAVDAMLNLARLHGFTLATQALASDAISAGLEVAGSTVPRRRAALA